MADLHEANLLRVYVGESDRAGGRPAYEAIVEGAREAGLAGATVLRGRLGFGAGKHLHSARVLRLAEDLPLVVEIVDEPERIAAFLPRLEEWMSDGLATVETVRVVRGGPRRGK